mmetsp:Transcript_27413/g.29920  ORF Transcript_27413/g.29920 Transcript_27413/m.29920 type:complete len:310 (+) Transcript_27413:71-1000(+)
MMMNSKKSFSEANKSSLFVGNLSILCDEDALRKLFLPFGPVSSVRIKRGDDPQRSHLSYGFVDFVSIESADRAMQLNNVIFLGRALKIGRAEDFATRRSNRKNQLREAIEGTNNHSIPPTAQIHVSFATRQTQRPFCELQLRQVFGQFPNLVDVAIKKNVTSPTLQSGYAFVHYSMNDAGIRSALAAVECLNGRTVDGVKFECSVTHGLKTHLISLKSVQKSFSPALSKSNSDSFYAIRQAPSSTATPFSMHSFSSSWSEQNGLTSCSSSLSGSQSPLSFQSYEENNHNERYLLHLEHQVLSLIDEDFN